MTDPSRVAKRGDYRLEVGGGEMGIIIHVARLLSRIVFGISVTHSFHES